MSKIAGKAVSGEFDYVVLAIGWQEHVIPVDAARAFFDACIGREVYQLSSHYEDGESRNVCKRMTMNESPRLKHISPSEMFMGIEMARILAEREAAKRAEKEAAEKAAQ